MTRYCTKCGHRLTPVEAARADRKTRNNGRLYAALLLGCLAVGAGWTWLVEVLTERWMR